MTHITIKEENCIACGLCQVYCRVEHSKSRDIIKAFKKENVLPRVRLESCGDVSFAISCRHCDQPWCVYSCLTGAMQKDPVTGLVIHNPEHCIGCWSCVLACPYGALMKDSDRGIVIKCDFCRSRKYCLRRQLP